MAAIKTIEGKPIYNSKKPLDIVIRTSEATRGSGKDPTCCAAALAAIHSVKGCTRARVHVAVSYLEINGKWYRYATPGTLRTEIVGFDRGAKFSPGVYTLRPLKKSSTPNGKRLGGPSKERVARGKKAAQTRQRMLINKVRFSPNYV
jgi:hypothetical protein